MLLTYFNNTTLYYNLHKWSKLSKAALFKKKKIIWRLLAQGFGINLHLEEGGDNGQLIQFKSFR